MKRIGLLLIALSAFTLRAAETDALTLPVGHLKPGAVVKAAGEVTLREPDGPRGQYKHGFRVLNDSAADWQKFWGVSFEIKLPSARETEITADIFQFQSNTNTPDLPVTATVRLVGKGWQTVTLPWNAFHFEQANTAFLKFVKKFRITAKPAAEAPRATSARTGGADLPDSRNARQRVLSAPMKFQFRNVRVIKAPVISLEAEVCGKPAPRNGSATYDVAVGNCTEVKQAVTLSLVKHGWEEMVSTVEPAAFDLAPGETRHVTLTVKVSDRVPPGGHEEQVLQAIGNGDAADASQLKFITTSELPHPYILFTAKGWQEVRDKVAQYDWAEAEQGEILRRAESWRVPEIADPARAPDDTYGPYVFATQSEGDLLACAYAWQLTRDTNDAEKVALFLRRLSDPAHGYPATLRACNQSLVQEGEFFQHVAMAYDMILDSDVLSATDRAQIENTFRLFMETIARASDYGPINNWNLAEDCGAFYCALAMQDLAAAQRWFSGPAGICDQLGKGVMDDGWWYECSISYNLWCAGEFTQAALGYAPFGVDFLHEKVPASYSPRVLLQSLLSGGVTTGGTPEERHKPFGMDPDLYGPNTKPYRDIKMMWDSVLPFIDYRGVMFGVNDSTENRVTSPRYELGGASPFELAYYAFRDPAYASLIKLAPQRDLLYGVPDLPPRTPDNFRNSAYADNVGLVMLRSQATNRPISDQIQAALHYGTHGWAHGHFDRTDLLCLERDGRNFWNPESVFWGYKPFMYKFYCQCSLNHNLVVVDEKMQEATPGERLLFHTGSLMQAAVVQTKARWSNPPYGGMVYDYVPVKTFAEKCWREGRSVPIPANPPRYGSLTGYTEPILQRRLLIVMDDYIVLADYLKGTNKHTFENVLQLKGFQGLDAPEKSFLRHTAQWNPDPLGSAQFVTDCNWYSVTAPAVARYIERWGPGADNEGSRSVGNAPGAMKLDVHSLWPPKQKIMIGAAPEMLDVSKRLWWTVRGDGNVLTDGQFGAWILGQADIDVSVAGVKQLELETKTEQARQPTLFWANARIVTKAGREIPLTDLMPTFENVHPVPVANHDYFGGPIKIVGTEYKLATPAEPEDESQPAFVRVDLSGANAVRFQATLGGDYPLGDESQRRKVTAIRAPRGDQARFLTLIEPYTDRPLVKSAEAESADKLRVELNDGRMQEIVIHNFDGDGKHIVVKVTETQGGQILRQDSANEEATQ